MKNRIKLLAVLSLILFVFLALLSSLPTTLLRAAETNEIEEFTVVVDTEALVKPYPGISYEEMLITNKDYLEDLEVLDYEGVGLTYGDEPLEEWDEYPSSDISYYLDEAYEGKYIGYITSFVLTDSSNKTFNENTKVIAEDKEGNPVDIYYSYMDYAITDEIVVIYDLGQSSVNNVKEIDIIINDVDVINSIKLIEGNSFEKMGYFTTAQFYSAFGELLTFDTLYTDTLTASPKMEVSFAEYDSQVLRAQDEMIEARGEYAWEVFNADKNFNAGDGYKYGLKYTFMFESISDSDMDPHHVMFNFLDDLKVNFKDSEGNTIDKVTAYVYPYDGPKYEYLSETNDAFDLYLCFGEVEALELIDELEISIDKTYFPEELYTFDNGNKIIYNSYIEDVFKKYYDYYNEYGKAPQIFTTNDERVKIFFEHDGYPYKEFYQGPTGLVCASFSFSDTNAYDHIDDASGYIERLPYGFTFAIIFDEGYSFDINNIKLPEGFVALKDLNEWNAESHSYNYYDEHYWEFGERALYVGYEVATGEEYKITDIELEFNKDLFDSLNMVHGEYNMYMDYHYDGEFYYANFPNLNIITSYNDKIISDYDRAIKEILGYFPSLDEYWAEVEKDFAEYYGQPLLEEWKYISQGYWLNVGSDGVYGLDEDDYAYYFNGNFKLIADEQYAFAVRFATPLYGCEFDLGKIEESLAGTGFLVDYNLCDYHVSYDSQGEHYYSNELWIYYPLPLAKPVEIDLELKYNEELETSIDELELGMVVPEKTVYDDDDYVVSSVFLPNSDIIKKLYYYNGIIVCPSKISSYEDLYDGIALYPGELISTCGHAYSVISIEIGRGYYLSDNIFEGDIPEGYEYVIEKVDAYDSIDGVEPVYLLIYKYIGEIDYEQIEEVDIALNPAFEEYFSNMGIIDYDAAMNAFEIKDKDPKYIPAHVEIWYEDSNGELCLLEVTDYFIPQPGIKYYILGIFGTGVSNDDVFDFTGYRFADEVKNNSECHWIKLYSNEQISQENKLIGVMFELPQVAQEEITSVNVVVNPVFLEKYNAGIYDYDFEFVSNDQDPKYYPLTSRIYYKDSNGNFVEYDPSMTDYTFVEGLEYYISCVLITGFNEDNVSLGKYKFADNVIVPEGYTVKPLEFDVPAIEITYKLPTISLEKISEVDIEVNPEFLEMYQIGGEISAEWYDQNPFLINNLVGDERFVLTDQNLQYIDDYGYIHSYQYGMDFFEYGYGYVISAEYFINDPNYRFDETVLNKNSENYELTVLMNGLLLEVTYFLPELDFKPINVVDVTISKDFMENFKPGNDPYLVENLFDINDLNPNYFVDDAELFYETEDGKLEVVEEGSKFELGVKYFAKIALITGFDQYAMYRFAADVTTKVEKGYSIEFIGFSSIFANHGIFVTYEIGELALYNLSDGKAEIILNNSLVYNGQPQKQEIIVKYDGEVLTENVHYTVSDNVNTNAGTYTLKVTGIGLSQGELNAEYEIEKATYDLSDIEFEDVTVTYDGKQHEISIFSMLPEGLSVTYINNSATDAGVYNAVAKFEYDTLNYNEIADMGATLTINKLEVAVPEAKTSFVYNGTTQVALVGSELYTVELGSATNAGKYEAVVNLKDAKNYIWKTSFNGKIAWEIKKATYDVSNIKFEDVTVTYDGKQHEILISGTLPEGLKVTYKNNSATDAGVYNAVAKFEYDTLNYNEIADMEATLTINKLEVAVPEAKTSFVYNGTTQVALVGSELYTVELGSATNAGKYEAVVNLKDAKNYIWKTSFNGKIAWEIKKATYDVSNIKFEDVTVTYDGKQHEILISGTLPEGLKVTYKNNSATDAGVYNAVAKFEYDTLNYNEIADMEATLTIKKSAASFNTNTDNEHSEDVIITTEEGLDPNSDLVVELVEMVESTETFEEFLDVNQKVAVAYDIKLLKDGISVQPNGTLKVRILIPEDLIGKDFSLLHIHNENEKSVLEYTIDGDYIVFETDKLSSFVFVYEMGSLLWVAIVLAVIVIIELAFLSFLKNKNKQIKSKKLLSAYPPFILGMFVPEWHIILIICLATIAFALAIFDIIYAYRLLKMKD